MDNTIPHKLQAVLYAHGGEMKKSQILTVLSISSSHLIEAQKTLQEIIAGQGIELFETDTTLSLRTATQYVDFLKELRQKDDEKDIGTAALEVLSIVLYKNGTSRSTIDYIRGVNSSGTLRQLVLRGLLERSRSTTDTRAWVYTATPELLAHIGISSYHELPEYSELSSALNEQEQLEIQQLHDEQ
ncbi:SMC-Scp complex subunit ScpB [Candidatus Kaiserbacteria bacterium]|nr:MAG: SMC-Scp complex subunit ScpB [Candidatus Kaiserbacteria bacterium]